MLTDAENAALYDLMNPWDPAGWPADAFYHGLVMAAGAVLDVGCGTGAMLGYARAAGHTGRLTGIDPSPAMLARARRHDSIEWVAGTAAQAAWDREFDLAVMTGHAFQCLVADDDVVASLAAVRAALRVGGRFAFETRHPQARAWLDWNPSQATETVDAAGRTLRIWHEVESVRDGVVTFTETAAAPSETPMAPSGTAAEPREAAALSEPAGGPSGTVVRVDRASLRFLDVPELAGFLARAGFAVEAQYGDWRHGPITSTSREIVTIARRP